MTYVLTSAEMRAADAQASAASSDVALMRAAGKRIAEAVEAQLPQGGRVVAFAGPGNNGGDAFAALAELPSFYERIVYAASAGSASAARNDAQTRARAAGVDERPLPENDDGARAALNGTALALDGLFGTGARLPIGEAFRAAARALDRERVPVLAIDIPSGIDGDTGARSDDAVRATMTVTLAALKPGLLLEPGREYAGDLWIGDIGITSDVLAAHAKTFAALDDDAFLSLLPHRAP
ncbi:MAG: NAD(P)H-hydrate epimerase, partial [Candidatus Eremiobacteraeota bacterium]|nr:NAD(P)H-hydrate epimerase [Candidatus Eremiobacteraeota bacterium]